MPRFVQTWPRWLKAALLVCAVLAVVFGVWAVRTAISVAGNIQGIVSAEFERRFGGTLSASDVSWHWGRVDLRDVSVTSPSLPGEITIKRVRVRVSLLSVLQYDLDSAVERVEFVSPELLLDRSIVKRLQTWRSREKTEPIETVPNIEFVIADGSIRFESTQADSAIPLATGIVGWIRSAKDVGINLSGSMLSDDVNLRLFGTFPLDGMTPDVQLTLDDVRLDRLQTYLDAHFDGTANLMVVVDDSLHAEIGLVNAEYRPSDSLHVGPVSALVKMDGKEAWWDRVDLPVNGLVFSTDGRVAWGDKSEIDARAEWSGDVDRLGGLFSERLADLHGNVRGEIELRGSPSNPIVAFDVRSDSLVAAGVVTQDIVLTGHTEPSDDPATPVRLTVDRMEVTVPGGRITGGGDGTIHPMDMAFYLNRSDIRLEGIRLLREADVSGRATLYGEARVTSRSRTASLSFDDFNLAVRGRPVPVQQVTAEIDTAGSIVLRGQGATFTGRAEVIKDTLTDARIEAVARLNRFELPFGDTPPRVSGDVSATIELDALALDGALIVDTGKRPAFPVEISLETGLRESTSPLVINIATPSLPVTRLRPDVRATITRSDGIWHFGGEAWRNRLRFTGSAVSADEYSAVVRVVDAPAGRTATLARLETFITGGTLNGRLSIDHTEHTGLIGSGSFRIDPLTIRDVDGLRADVDVAITPDSVTWASGPISSRDGRAMAFNSGVYRLNERSVDSQVWSPPDSRLEDGLALAGVPLQANGDALWSVEIHDSQGDTVKPHFEIEVLATKGELVGIPFDTTHVRLVGDTRRFAFEHGYLTKTGFYAGVTEGGGIPITEPNGELDIPIHIRHDTDNDVLWLLTHIVDQGVEGHGSGHGFIRVAGPPSEVVIGEGWAEVTDGRITWPGEIWPTWRGVNIRASIERGSRLLSFDAFEARVGGGVIHVENVPSERIGATPLVIETVGLTLGVLQITTPREIPFRIPGGVRAGEWVNIRLRGNERVDRFTIAGPIERMLFVGEITASDGFFTYPFETLETGSDSEGADFIGNAEWHVDFVVGRNLVYETRTTQSLWRSLLRNPIELLGSMAAEIEARLAEGGRIKIRGSYGDKSLTVISENLISEQARLSVLDIEFSQDGPLVFDWDSRLDSEPVIRGRGVATVEVSSGADILPTPGDDTPRGREFQRIYARLVSVDPSTGVVREGGRLGELTVELDTDDIRGGLSGQERQLAILEMLGYYNDPWREGAFDSNGERTGFDPRELASAGYRTIVRRSEQQAWRSLFLPFSRQMRRFTRLDVIDVRPSILFNLLNREFELDGMAAEQAYLAYLQGTNWTFGEYLWGGLLLSYHGQLELTSLSSPTLGARHQVVLEWAVSPRTRVELSRDLNVPFGEPDTRVGLSHRFAFQSY